MSPAKDEEEEDEYINYDISGLCSDDSTDDELQPKKKLPTWADGQYQETVFYSICCVFHFLLWQIIMIVVGIYSILHT